MLWNQWLFPEKSHLLVWVTPWCNTWATNAEVTVVSIVTCFWTCFHFHARTQGDEPILHLFLFVFFLLLFLAFFFFLQHKSSDNLTHPWEVHCFCRCWRHSLNSLTLTFTGQTPFCLMKPDQVSAAVGKTKVFWNRDAFLLEPIGIRQCYQVTWMYQCWGFSHCNFKLLLA